MRWFHVHVMLCMTCVPKPLVSKMELGTRIAMTLCSAVTFKRLHDGPFSCLEGLSLEVVLHTVYLAWESAAGNHTREGLVRLVARGVQKDKRWVLISFQLLLVPKVSHSAGCVMARVD